MDTRTREQLTSYSKNLSSKVFSPGPVPALSKRDEYSWKQQPQKVLWQRWEEEEEEEESVFARVRVWNLKMIYRKRVKKGHPLKKGCKQGVTRRQTSPESPDLLRSSQRPVWLARSHQRAQVEQDHRDKDDHSEGTALLCRPFRAPCQTSWWWCWTLDGQPQTARERRQQSYEVILRWKTTHCWLRALQTFLLHLRTCTFMTRVRVPSIPASFPDMHFQN